MDMEHTPASGLKARSLSVTPLCPLPPDVEPLPFTEEAAMRRWLDARRMHGCDRDSALKGFQIGRDIGNFVLYITRELPRRWRAPTVPQVDAADRPGARHRSRVRRAGVYRRTRALQLKKNYGR